MARFTLTIEGEHTEFQVALQQLLGMVDTGRLDDSEGTMDGDTITDGTEPWSRDELARLWSGIRPEARVILAELTNRPDGYSFNELQESLHLEGLIVGGQLSSVGHAKRRLYPRKPDPVRRDYSRRMYYMEPEVADAIRELAQR